MDKVVSFTEAIRQATQQSLQNDKNVVVMGLGVSYKNGADGTMGTLKEEFPDRVHDVPVSESCNTGVAVGAAITGLRPIVHHARVEFGLYAVDQIITQAAKWNYMFGGGNAVPLVIRLAVGRQWGNGPQHTQSLYSLFGGVPGLKVVIPSSPYMAKGLLNAAVDDNNPVIFMESRWLYGLKESVPEERYAVPLDKARIVRYGTKLTLVAYGDGVVDAIKASEILQNTFGIDIEVIDLVSINPIDHDTVRQSVKKTGNLICLDTTTAPFGIGSEVISTIAQNWINYLDRAPMNLTTPYCPCPTATSLTENYYQTKADIVNRVLGYLEHQQAYTETLSFEELHILPKHEVVTRF